MVKFKVYRRCRGVIFRNVMVPKGLIYGEKPTTT